MITGHRRGSTRRKRAKFCRRCGARMAAITVRVQVEYDPQTGKAAPETERRWDCPDGAHGLAMGYEFGHVSPDMEVLP